MPRWERGALGRASADEARRRSISAPASFDACAEMASRSHGDGTHGAALMRSSPPFADIDAVVSRASRLGEICAEMRRDMRRDASSLTPPT